MSATNQEPETPYGFSLEAAGAHALEPSLTAFPGALARSWIAAEHGDWSWDMPCKAFLVAVVSD